MKKSGIWIIIVILVLLVAGLYWWRNAEGGWLRNEANQDRQGEQTGTGSRTEEAGTVRTEDPEYFEDTRGYYARPASDGEYPGVIMIHEWWGLNQHIKEMADRLATEGYQVLAVDLYGGEVATDAARAQALTVALNQQQAVSNLQAAADWLRERGAARVASLGWCFGGGQSLRLALSGEPLDATVVYYGNLETDSAKLEQINWPVLGVFGDQDTSIPVATVRQFETGLDEAGVENEIYVYPGVGHAFANPSNANYSSVETADAWTKTLAFLERELKNGR